MKSDFTPIVHNIPGRDAHIYAIADVHIGAKECDIEGFEAFLKRIAKEKDSYLVLCGDMLNNATRTSVSNVYEDVLSPSGQIRECVRLLTPVKDKILGMVMGNHEGRSIKDDDLDPFYDVAVMLGIQDLYRQNMAFLNIRLKNQSSTKVAYQLLLMHGKTENKKRKFAYAVEGVDAIITGHTHNGIVERPAHLIYETQHNTVTVKSVVSLTATSWLSYGGYGARGMYMPAETSSPQCLKLKWMKTNHAKKRIEVSW